MASWIERLHESKGVEAWPERLKSMHGVARGGVERISCSEVFDYLGVPVTPRSRNATAARYLQSLLQGLGWKNESRQRLRTSHFYRPVPREFERACEASVAPQAQETEHSPPKQSTHSPDDYVPSIDVRRRAGDRSMRY